MALKVILRNVRSRPSPCSSSTCKPALPYLSLPPSKLPDPMSKGPGIRCSKNPKLAAFDSSDEGADGGLLLLGYDSKQGIMAV